MHEDVLKQHSSDNENKWPNKIKTEQTGYGRRFKKNEDSKRMYGEK
jgi:hypothetical protein